MVLWIKHLFNYQYKYCANIHLRTSLLVTLLNIKISHPSDLNMKALT